MTPSVSNGRRDYRHSHPHGNSILMNQFEAFSDDIFGDFSGGNGFSSFSSFNSNFGHGGGGGGGGGAVKRTSTSTTFVNGKKLMTKK